MEIGIPPARGKCICVRDTAGLQFFTTMLLSSVLPVSSVLAFISPPVKVQQENNYSLSGSCSPLFQACVVNSKYKRHWWTVSVLTSKETEFSKAVWICLGQHQDNLFIQSYASQLLSENFCFPYDFNLLFSCRMTGLSLKSMESSPSSSLEQGTILSIYSKTTEITDVNRNPLICIAELLNPPWRGRTGHSANVYVMCWGRKACHGIAVFPLFHADSLIC